VAARARRVRLEGERGTGKNLAAQYLHRLWRPPGAPFVELNVAAISAADGRELAEVFGHSIGAFTGAVRDLPGLLEEAHQGTAFLNELGTASATVQKVLLRVLDRGLDPRRVVRRLGEHRDRPLDIRVITATNEDLEAAVARGAFRPDLFDRLGRVTVRMPALRDRLPDVPALAAAILRRRTVEIGVPPPVLDPGTLDRLRRYRWPGNVRELESAMEVFFTFGHLPEHLNRVTGKGWDCPADHRKHLTEHDGNVSEAARALGIARSTLYEALRRRTLDERPQVSGSERHGHLSDTSAME
jgi:two-component system NtrC family response regulator